MSAEIEARFRAAVVPQIEKLATDLPAKFLADMGDVVELDNPRILAALERIRDMKVKSMIATTARHARAYSQAVEQELGALRSLFLAEKVVKSRAAASAVTQAFKMALNGLVEIGTAAVSILVSGTAKGLADGKSGINPGSIFHS